MIQSWKSGAARAIFEGRDSGKGFPPDLVSATRRRLDRLDQAATVEDLRVPPSHRLHKLDGDRRGQWSLSINDQFRICFRWGRQGPEDVEVVDYH